MTPSQAQWRQETVERIGEAPTGDPVDRLRHVVRVFEGVGDDYHVITATSNVYAERHWTGLTLGDLRRLLDRVDES